MGWLSKITPNELKGGGWADYAGAAVGIATGNPWLAALAGGAGAAYRGSNIFGGAATAGLGTGLFNMASGSGFMGGASGGGAGNWWDDLFANASGGVPAASGGGAPVTTAVSPGAAGVAPVYDLGATAAGGAAASGGGSPIADIIKQVLGGGAKGGGTAAGGGSLGTANNLLGLASGAYGLYTGAQTRKLAEPGRDAAKRLQMLASDPAAVRGMPGYAEGLGAGRQELDRMLGAQGQTGGGLAAEAMAKFGGAYDTNFRNAELQRLQSISQGAVPAEREANDIVRQSLEQLSYIFRRR